MRLLLTALLALALPVPTGPYPVGGTTMHLIDHARPDPWVSDPPYRELMISIFYPAKKAAEKTAQKTAPYMLDAAAEHFDSVTMNDYLGLGLPEGSIAWNEVRTAVAEGAPIERGRFPVVLLSPGLGEPRTWMTTLATQLASTGYLVVSIDNTYESPEVEFPDGRLATLSGAEPTVAWVEKMMAARVADTRFVLDWLEHVEGADLSAVGMVGHSAGGAATARAMAADPRIKAGVNLDGTLSRNPADEGDLSEVARTGVDRPFLLMGSDGGESIATSPSWASFYAHSTGWKADFTLVGSRHASFTDAQALLPQVTESRDAIGTIDPALSLSTQYCYIGGFFDRFLKNRPAGFLDDPTPAPPIERE